MSRYSLLDEAERGGVLEEKIAELQGIVDAKRGVGGVAKFAHIEHLSQELKKRNPGFGDRSLQAKKNRCGEAAALS